MKTTNALNESCKNLNIDLKNITTESADGSHSFTPWPAIHRWREGKLVFTIGGEKNFCTVSKGALGEMQSANSTPSCFHKVARPLSRDPIAKKKKRSHQGRASFLCPQA